jgi:hypothetical protein
VTVIFGVFFFFFFFPLSLSLFRLFDTNGKNRGVLGGDYKFIWDYVNAWKKSVSEEYSCLFLSNTRMHTYTHSLPLATYLAHTSLTVAPFSYSFRTATPQVLSPGRYLFSLAK